MKYFGRFEKGHYKDKSTLAKIWYFIWHEDSIESWIINIVLAFIIIKFIVYPGLGFILGTTHPIVAVVSGSMEHKENFDDYWLNAGKWYESRNITKEQFKGFPMHNGFNRGDIMVLKKAEIQNVKPGDIIVFVSARQNPKPDPIIHRLVAKTRANGEYIFQTKGDNYFTNPAPINNCRNNICIFESDIHESQIIGKAFIRVPFLGYIKIWFVDFICLFNNNLNFCIRG
jgi:signal peptidase I